MQFEYELSRAADYEAKGQVLHAVQLYKKIIDRDPSETEPYLKLINIYKRMENFDAAQTLIGSMLENCPEQEYKNLAVHLYFSMLDWQNAAVMTEELGEEADNTTLFLAGYSNFRLGEYKKAEGYLLKFLSRHTGREFKADAYLTLGKVYIQLGKYDSAEKILSQAENTGADSEALSLLRAKIYYYLDMTTHAVTEIEKALRGKPDREVFEFAGRIYLKSGEYEKVENLFYDVIAEYESSPDIYAMLGAALYHLNKVHEAETFISTALKLEPDNELALSINDNFTKTSEA